MNRFSRITASDAGMRGHAPSCAHVDFSDQTANTDIGNPLPSTFHEMRTEGEIHPRRVEKMCQTGRSCRFTPNFGIMVASCRGQGWRRGESRDVAKPEAGRIVRELIRKSSDFVCADSPLPPSNVQFTLQLQSNRRAKCRKFHGRRYSAEERNRVSSLCISSMAIPTASHEIQREVSLWRQKRKR